MPLTRLSMGIETCRFSVFRFFGLRIAKGPHRPYDKGLPDAARHQHSGAILKPQTEIHFFFQAEDGIRDSSVTGVQTCALPILMAIGELDLVVRGRATNSQIAIKIGRASCRERV